MKLFEIKADRQTGEWIQINRIDEISEKNYLSMEDTEDTHWDHSDWIVDPQTNKTLHGPDGENAAIKLCF